MTVLDRYGCRLSTRRRGFTIFPIRCVRPRSLTSISSLQLSQARTFMCCHLRIDEAVGSALRRTGDGPGDGHLGLFGAGGSPPARVAQSADLGNPSHWQTPHPVSAPHPRDRVAEHRVLSRNSSGSRDAPAALIVVSSAIAETPMLGGAEDGEGYRARSQSDGAAGDRSRGASPLPYRTHPRQSPVH